MNRPRWRSKLSSEMHDQDLTERIEQLALEEHELFAKESRGEAATRERTRLKEIEGEVDALYEALRLRRARRAAGLDPEGIGIPEPRAEAVEDAFG